MVPSNSAFGVSAATESRTMTSSAPLRARDSTMFRASSPEDGCATSKLSRSTPMCLAYPGSSACSTSTNAAMPPAFWAFAITCKANVVLPEDSGPNNSTIRPRGRPQTPNAMSRPNEPVGMTSIFLVASPSPSLMIAPSPKSLRICAIAASRAEVFTLAASAFLAMMNLLSFLMSSLRRAHSNRTA